MTHGSALKANMSSISLPMDSAPIGTVQYYGGATAPSGWLICDGSAVSRTIYAPLFAVIGTTFGVGDGSTTFNLPDGRGIFIRGSGTSNKLTNANGTSFSGILGTYQNDKIQGHRHTVYPHAGYPGGTTQGAAGGDTTTPVYSGTTSDATADGTNGTPRTGLETNPANLALTCIIKASEVLREVIVGQNTIFHPVGTINMFGGAIAPYGWSLCDGRALSRSEYVDLFNIIGTTYGVGDGSTTFNIPDFRGIFPRGAGTSGKLTNANGVAFASTLGTYENDKMQGHYHALSAGANFPVDSAGTGFANGSTNSTAQIRGPITDGTNGTPRTGAETNPANLSVNFIIKIKNVINAAQSTYPPVIYGTTSPTITPQFISQEYINTAYGSIYKAIGTSGPHNWACIGTGSVSQFTKDTVPGLVAWFDSADLSTITKNGSNQITSWLDKSGGNRHLVNVSTAGPVLTSAVQNGLPAAYFNGSSGIYSANFTAIGNPHTTFIVFKPTAWGTGGQQTLLAGWLGSSSYTSLVTGKYAGVTNVGAYEYNTWMTGQTINSGSPYIITTTFNGSSSILQVNNNSVTTGSTGTQNFVSLWLGKDNNAAGTYTGYEMEILIFSGALAEEYKAIIRTYLNNKWAIFSI